MNNNTTQRLPHQATKQEVRKWYHKIPTRTVNQIIKAAIIEVNKTTNIQTSLRTHALNRHHLTYIIDELGKPNLGDK